MMGQLVHLISQNADELERAKDPTEAVVSFIKRAPELTDDQKIELAVFWRYRSEEKKKQKDAKALVGNWWRKAREA